MGHCGVVTGWVLRGGPGASFGRLGGACQPGGSSGAEPGPAPCHANPMARRSTNIFFEPCFIDELQALGSSRIAAPGHNTLVLIARDDEVLDWREMAAFCIEAQVRPAQGSDDALSDFDAHLPTIFDFCAAPDVQVLAQTP